MDKDIRVILRDTGEKGTVVETNGNLSYIENDEGKGNWYSPSEWELDDGR